MKRHIIFCFITVFIACNSKEREAAVPANVLPREKMIEIMVEVNITEAALNLNYLNDSKVRDTKEYEDVFKRKKVSKEQYDESLKYYTEHPDDLIQMYDEVLNELSRMQAKVAGPVRDTVAMPSIPDKPSRSILSRLKKKS